MSRLLIDKNISVHNRSMKAERAANTKRRIRRTFENNPMNRRAFISCISLLVVFCLGLVPINGAMLRDVRLSRVSPASLEPDREESMVAVESATGAQGQRPPIVKPFCTDFNDNSEHGWDPCTASPQVNIKLDKPGPSGDPADIYLHAKDLSGASAICASPEYRGNWTEIASAGCSSLCFDVRIINDGDVNNHTNITPSVILISDPDGNGPAPPLRAIFKANFTVSEDQGANPGWHNICAPIALLSAGNLPVNGSGVWTMLDNNPNSVWNNLLANITDVQLPIDFTSNPAEEAGYDNICIKRQACACADAKAKDIKCKPGGAGSFTFSLEVENHSGAPVGNILLTPASNSSFTLTQQQFALAQPLPDGAATSLNVGINSAAPGQEICFTVTLVDTEFRVCGCSAKVCITLPSCDCAQFIDEKITQGNNGTFIYTFTIVNTTSTSFTNLYLLASPGVTVTPSHLSVSGSQFTGTVAISGAAAGSEVCFNVGLYDDQMNNCCRLKRHCVKLPGYKVK